MVIIICDSENRQMKLNSVEEMVRALNHDGGAAFRGGLQWIPGEELKSRIYIKFKSYVSRSL